MNFDLHRNVSNTKPLSRDICGLRYWKTNFDLSIIFRVFLDIFRFKDQKNLSSENFGNSFKTVVTSISKWPSISKIWSLILDYEMLCVLSNNLVVFDSSRGTPSRFEFSLILKT